MNQINIEILDMLEKLNNTEEPRVGPSSVAIYIKEILEKTR